MLSVSQMKFIIQVLNEVIENALNNGCTPEQIAELVNFQTKLEEIEEQVLMLEFLEQLEAMQQMVVKQES